MLPETEYLESEIKTRQIQDRIDDIVNQAKKDAHVDTGALKKSIFGICGNSANQRRVKKDQLCEFEMLFYGVYYENSNLVELVPSKIFNHPTVIYFVTETGERLSMTKSAKYIPTPQGKLRTRPETKRTNKVSKISTVPKISKQDNSGYTFQDFTNMLNIFNNKKNEQTTK